MTIDFKEVCKQTQDRLTISQAELGRRIGMSPENFSKALRGGRPITAEAVIELSEITGENAKQLLIAAKKLRSVRGKVADAIMSAALGVLLAVSLFLTPTQETHAASMGYDGRVSEVKIIAAIGSFGHVACAGLSRESLHTLVPLKRDECRRLGG